MNTPGHRKQRTGFVVSAKMDKTVVVRVQRRYKHPTFHKYVTSYKKYPAHNPENLAHMGDQVVIEETRPLSKTKNWRVKTVLKKAV
ncbi:MAG: 30S ribosomal protein S17 [Myxococcales bacterium]|nr:MAG: 30S ribosomal protein S17 [Myxococcales bacterium]